MTWRFKDFRKLGYSRACEPDEWAAVQAEGREPDAAPWPAEHVSPALPGGTVFGTGAGIDEDVRWLSRATRSDLDTGHRNPRVC
jgi:hypothetical protein